MSPVVSALEPIDRLSLISFSPGPCSTIALDQTKNASWLISHSVLGQHRPYYGVYHSTSDFSWLIILYSLNFKLIKKALSPCSLPHFNRAELAVITNCAIEMSLIRLRLQVEAHCNRVNEVISYHIETDLRWSHVWKTTFIAFRLVPDATFCGLPI